MKINFNALKPLLLFAAILWIALPMSSARSEQLDKPTGDVVLVVRGAISNTNENDEARFDLDMLKALPRTGFETTTIWTEGKHLFEGVSLKDLLQAVGARGRVLETAAINDYVVEVPVSDAVQGGPIIAYAMNGEPMSVREKGPLWLVYPYDAKAEYRSEITYSRSIWQLVAVDVLQ